MKLKQQRLTLLAKIQLVAILLAVCGNIVPWKAASASFTAMTTPLPNNNFAPGHMLLLSDGRVMVQDYNSLNGWYFLLPDSNGHYISGNWSNCPSMTHTRLFYSSDILTNDNVFVAGAEIGSGSNNAELFDTTINRWTPVPVPANLLYNGPSGDSDNSQFRDSPSVLLSNGKVMIAPIFPATNNATVIYDPVANTVSGGPISLGDQNEACWVKLPDDSILTIDKDSTNSERFIPSLNKWIPDASLPVYLWSTNSEIGASLLLANGTVMSFGGTNSTAIYTPSPMGGTNIGSWVQGTNLPPGLVMRDAPSAVLNNGKLLLSFNEPTGDSPFHIYEYDPNTEAFTLVFTDDLEISDQTSMVELPDGTVLFNDTYTIYVYQPDVPPLPAGKPAIQSVSWNADGSLHLTGTLFNGISQGAMYGDDAQQDSNFPLVRFTGGGNVYYGRTYNWSSTSVQTGSKSVATECTLPGNVLTNGLAAYSMQVVANGNASDAVTIYGPVWVDFNYSKLLPQLGTFANPYSTLGQGVTNVITGGTISIKPGVSSQTLLITKAMTINAIGGTATVGQ